MTAPAGLGHATLYREHTQLARWRTDWLPAALVATVTGYAALARPAGSRLADLGVYLGAVDGLRHGRSLYDFASAAGAPFTYPPFAGLLFWPLGFVPLPALGTIWTAGTLATLWWLVHRVAPPAAAPMVALAVALSAPVSSNLRFGQVSVFLAALVAADLLVLHGSRAQGVLIGLAAAVKLTPLIFIPMLWLAGQRRSAVTAAGTFAAATALGVAVLPADSWRYWTTEIRDVSRLGHITAVGNQSLNGALLRLGLTAPARSVIVFLVGGAVAAVAVWRAARLARGGDRLAALIVTGAASVVLSPVSWTHHETWLVLAVLLPVRRDIRAVWITTVLVIMVLPVTALGPPLWSNARLLLAVVVAACGSVIDRRSDLLG